MSHFETSAGYLEEAARLSRSVKEATYSLLDLQNAQRILDVGCGTGVDLVEIAVRTPDSVQVVGIDNDPEMVSIVRERISEKGLGDRISVLEGSALPFPFEAESFDRVRAERFFQVISPSDFSEEYILSELSRVLKSGGWLVLADTDWATASVDFSDSHIERKFLRFFSEECRPNGYSGRRFFGNMKRSGFSAIEVQVIPIAMYSFNKEDPLSEWLAKEITGTNATTKDESEAWLGELYQKSADGRFFASVNMNVVKGKK